MKPSNVAQRLEIHFESGGETLAGDLVLPAGPGPHPALLLVAGTGSQDRYGTIYFPSGKVGKRQLRRWISERLAQDGIASLIWDKRGVGASTGGNRQPGDPPGDRDQHASVSTDIEDSLNAFTYLQQRPEVDPSRVAVMGHSAGVYFACLLAQRTSDPAAYVFLGGVHQDILDFVVEIYTNLEDYVASSPENARWAEEHLAYELNFLRHWRAYRDAAVRGDKYYEMDYKGEVIPLRLKRIQEEIEWPLPEQFQYVQAPALVLHGELDLNVRTEEAYDVYQALKAGGNQDVTLVIVPGADHSMNMPTADLDEEQRLRERLLHISHRHPYSEFFIHLLIGWLKDRLITGRL